MADNKIYKSFDSTKSNEKFKSRFGQGVISFVSWERLLQYIEFSVDKRFDEKIDGIKIDETGIHVKIVKNENRG